MRSATFAAVIAIASLGAMGASPARAQCREDGSAQSFGDRYADALVGAAAGAGIGLAAGAVVGLLAPALFCSAEIGDGACEAAWIGGVGGLGGVGLVLGAASGTAIAIDARDSGPFAAAGFAILAGGLLLGGGVWLADETEEPGFLYAGLVAWALSVLVVTPLMALVFQGDADCAPAPASSPLAFGF